MSGTANVRNRWKADIGRGSDACDHSFEVLKHWHNQCISPKASARVLGPQFFSKIWRVQLSRASIFGALALCLISTSAVATEPSVNIAKGNDLLAACASPEALQYGMCMGYISGLVDGFTVADKSVICIPSGVTRGQLRDVVLNGMQSRRQELNEEGYAAALLAIAKAFPCQKRNGGGVR